MICAMRWLLVSIAIAAPTVVAADSLETTTVSEADVAAADASVTQRSDEIGALVTADLPKFKLRKGDVVRATNGGPPGLGLFKNSPLLYLDVLRGTQRVTIRVAILRAPTTITVERSELEPLLTGGTQVLAVKQGGVLIPALVRFGVVRKVDGGAIQTVAAATAALRKGIDKQQFVLEVETLDVTSTVTIKVIPSLEPLLDQISKKSETEYEVPRSVIDGITIDPMRFAKGARVVPAVKNGKPAGFKLYAVRPSSLFAKLGFANGDTVEKVNGTPLTTMESVLTVSRGLASAKTIAIDVVRRGKLVQLTIAIKP